MHPPSYSSPLADLSIAENTRRPIKSTAILLSVLSERTEGAAFCYFFFFLPNTGANERTQQQKKNSGFEDELSEVLESQNDENKQRGQCQPPAREFRQAVNKDVLSDSLAVSICSSSRPLSLGVTSTRNPVFALVWFAR